MTSDIGPFKNFKILKIFFFFLIRKKNSLPKKKAFSEKKILHKIFNVILYGCKNKTYFKVSINKYFSLLLLWFYLLIN